MVVVIPLKFIVPRVILLWRLFILDLNLLIVSFVLAMLIPLDAQSFQKNSNESKPISVTDWALF